ncbi:MAG: ATP phosphoribosyltransferase regulatory subunit [Parcubacteria group bacterium GW2011_GWA1_38_7]|nr:MAG: ATP phosphoribosyltransferase regulatory subunit [Parcubacteria group bacterium GW2011_GWA1_38_7]
MNERINKHEIPQPPRGTEDIFELRLLKIETVKSIFFDIARSHGFTRIDIPIFESAEVFKRTAEFSEDSSFTFPDKSGRQMVLRPDINAPISRAFVNHLAAEPLPSKLFFEGKVFRYRHAKRREFRMFGLETYGVTDFSADAEIVSTVGEMTKAIGFKGYEVEFSNLQIYKNLLEGILKQVDSKVVLHKLHFADSAETAQKILEEFNVSEKVTDNLLAMLFPHDSRVDSLSIFEHVAGQSQTLSDELTTVLKFRDALESYGIINAKLSLSNLHGTGFYSGITYRVQPLGVNIPLADGGRYDTMVENLGGKPTPATGLAFGVERIIDMAEGQGIEILQKKNEGYIVVLPKNTDVTELRTILQQARESCPSAIEEELLDRKPEHTKKYGTQKGYENAVFIENMGNSAWPLKMISYSLTNLSGNKKTMVMETPRDLVNFLVRR